MSSLRNLGPLLGLIAVYLLFCVWVGESFYSSIHHELGRLLQATTDLLSDMTRYPAVAVSPGPSGETVKALHVVPVADTTALTVVVTDSGRIVQELTRLPEGLSAHDLELTEHARAHGSC